MWCIKMSSCIESHLHQCQNLLMASSRNFTTLCLANVDAGEVLVIFIMAYFGVTTLFKVLTTEINVCTTFQNLASKILVLGDRTSLTG